MSEHPPGLIDEEELATTYVGELRHSPGWRRARIGVPLAGAAVTALIGLAATGSAGLLAAPVGAALGYGGWALALGRSARGRAREVALAAWVDARGLTTLEEAPPYDDTPLLRDGYRRSFGAGYSGAIAGHPGTIFAYTYVTRETRTRTSTDSNGNTHTETYTVDVDHDYTVCRVELALPGIPFLSVARRSFGLKLFDRISSALTSRRTVELESAAFDKEYRLDVADESDDLAVRRLFEPTTIVWFTDDGPQRLEAENGAIVIPIAGHTDDPDVLEALLAEAAAVVERFAAAVAPT